MLVETNKFIYSLNPYCIVNLRLSKAKDALVFYFVNEYMITLTKDDEVDFDKIILDYEDELKKFNLISIPYKQVTGLPKPDADETFPDKKNDT